jgi:cell shape-determining protein MreC
MRYLINFLFILVGVLIIASDLFNYSDFKDKKIKLESVILFKEFNIDEAFSKIFAIQYRFYSYIDNIEQVESLLKQNYILGKEVESLRNELKAYSYITNMENKSEYKKFSFIKADILNSDKNYALISNYDKKVDKNDLLINECGIFGKILHSGYQHSIVMRKESDKFLIPIRINNSENSGVYSFYENKIIEIKNRDIVKVGDKVFTFDKKSKIPTNIFIGNISVIDNNGIKVEIDKCENKEIVFVISKKD